MLRRAENVSMSYKPPGLLKTNGLVTVRVGRDTYHPAWILPSRWHEMMAWQSIRPIQILRTGERQYWHYQDRFYWDNDELSENQVHALLITQQQRQQARIERAEAMAAMGGGPVRTNRRNAIPDDVKQFVWRRDGGRCGHCGAKAELQFDHVIPVALGGSNGPENLQILCGPCNRRKGAGLTVR